MATSAKHTPEKDSGKEIARREISNDELLSISSFEDAIRLVEEVYGEVLTADQVIGNGFRMLTNKATLVGVPVMLLKWKFLPGDFAKEYVNILVVTGDGTRYLVNDGGSGISAQLREFTDRSERDGGLVVRHGFTQSDYTFCSERGCGLGTKCAEDDHERASATTFYLDLSA